MTCHNIAHKLSLIDLCIASHIKIVYKAIHRILYQKQYQKHIFISPYSVSFSEFCHASVTFYFAKSRFSKLYIGYSLFVYWRCLLPKLANKSFVLVLYTAKRKSRNIFSNIEREIIWNDHSKKLDTYLYPVFC